LDLKTVHHVTDTNVASSYLTGISEIHTLQELED